MRGLLEWFLDRVWAQLTLAAVLLVLLFYSQHRSLTERCDRMMALAESRRDSLEVTMACNKMVSDQAIANAIATGAGAAASR